MWIGTEEGVSQLKAGRVRNFTQREGLAKNPVRSIAEDASGSIWIGTGGGLNVFRDGVLRRQTFPHEPERDKTRVVHPARDGALWLGTADGLFHLMDGVWTIFRTTNGLANNDVRALLEDRAGNLWIGTAGSGVQRLSEGKFTSFTTTNGLANNSAWAFHEDNESALWIGTEGGLSRLHHGRLTTYTTRDGLPDNMVNAILEDDFGRLWVSHDRGIYWVRREEFTALADGKIKTLRCVRYDESDGLPSIETNGQKSYPAACKTRDGRLWFPTTKGVAVIDPRQVALDDVPPLASLEQVRANGLVVFGNRSPDVRAAGMNSTAKFQPSALHFAPGTARVPEFRYTANTFVAPEKSHFKYRLRGANEHWVDAGTRREAYFADLRPGDYEFEVIAANHRRIWQDQGATFAFGIAPFIYQTSWFYVLCGAGAAGFTAVVVAWRLRELRKIHRLEQQAAITHERSRIAKDLHDGLGADLTRLTLLADLASGESGTSSGEHVRKLSQTSREAARELKELIWVANPANDSVEGLVSRICQNAEDFLRDARIKCRLDIAPDLPGKPVSTEHRRNLLLVTREALNNVVKHAGASEVCIRAKTNGESLQLAIEDDGHGFDPATARPDGLGLSSMRRRIVNLGGTFDLESRPGAGTKILMVIKLGK